MLNDNVESFGASNIDDAITLLSDSGTGTLGKKKGSSDRLERHPERRVKAAFAAFEDGELPILKQENPSLKRSQLQELLNKKWQKSPDNPFNQVYISANCTAEQERLVRSKLGEEQLSRLKLDE